MSKKKRKKRRGEGRPTKYDPAAGTLIVQALQVGATLEVAASAAGVHRTTLWRWMKEGFRQDRVRKAPDTDENGKPTLKTAAQFCNAVKKAAAAAEVLDLSFITKAARSGNWTAAAWKLERKYPDRYARPAQRVVHEGGTTNTNVNVEAGAVDLSKLTDQELEDLDRLTAKAIDRAAPAAGRPDPTPPDGEGGEGEA